MISKSVKKRLDTQIGENKWCPQHGYPLPCNKCGGAIDYLQGVIDGKKLGRKEVVDWLEENFEPTVPMSLDYKKWHNKLKDWENEKDNC
jgi:hypothetical protein